MEQLLINELIHNYSRALSKKVYIEGIKNNKFVIRLKEDQSVYLWNNNKNIINIRGKINHLFLYNCKGVHLHVDELVSGVTCIDCNNCGIYFRRTPLSMVEISNSHGIILRSMYYNMPLLFNNVGLHIMKYMDYQVQEYYKIDDGIFSSWNHKIFNF